MADDDCLPFHCERPRPFHNTINSSTFARKFHNYLPQYFATERGRVASFLMACITWADDMELIYAHYPDHPQKFPLYNYFYSNESSFAAPDENDGFGIRAEATSESISATAKHPEMESQPNRC